MKSETFFEATIFNEDCREATRSLPENSIDSIVTDPPYALVSILKRFGKEGSAPAKGNEAFKRASSGFMGKSWDTGEVAFSEEFWAECLRVLKPGGHMVAFSGTRTQHRMVCAIEDAGFEIRDQIGWLYGSGFPKSHDVGSGWGTALKPAWEPICLARKPLSEGTVASNVLEHGTGAINIDGCRVGNGDDRVSGGKSGLTPDGGLAIGKSWNGGQLERPTGGRFPANVIHDGSDEVMTSFPNTKSGMLKAHHKIRESENLAMSGKNYARNANPSFGDEGSAARFFYSAKAQKSDREAGLEDIPKTKGKRGNVHPTVKPLELMRYLCRLITPAGGTVLDPFMGSGSTGRAACMDGYKFIGCELDPEYYRIAKARIMETFRQTSFL